MKKRWVILLIIGLLPIVIYFGYAIYSAIFGFTFFFDSSYGMDGFMDSLLITGVLYWPILLLGLGLVFISLFKIKKQKKSNHK